MLKALPCITVNATVEEVVFEIDSHCKDVVGGKFILRTGDMG